MKTTALVASAAMTCSSVTLAVTNRKMKLCLSPGAIGVSGKPEEIVALALRHGFEGFEPNGDFLGRLTDAELVAFRQSTKGLTYGAAGFPVEFRGEEAKFQASMATLPAKAAALKRAGVDRVSTWLSPSHPELSYAENFRQHATRLRKAAKILGDHGLRLGLEYVGTPSLRQGKKNEFVHSMRQAKELIGEIGTGNVGLVLDTWHWWTSGEMEADLLTLKPTDIISVDLNDAPAGIPVDQQQDGKRELPCATGVIPTSTFVNALNRIGYDGPLRAEPFNRPLNEMDNEQACAAVITSLRKAMASIK